MMLEASGAWDPKRQVRVCTDHHYHPQGTNDRVENMPKFGPREPYDEECQVFSL